MKESAVRVALVAAMGAVLRSTSSNSGSNVGEVVRMLMLI